MSGILDEVEKHRKEIKYETVTLTLSELVRMFEEKSKEVMIRPDFQRLFRWDREQQSLFVESLILEIPVPPIFCYENEDGIWELLDGLQRYSTIIRFMGESLTIPDEAIGIDNNNVDWHFDKANDISTKLQLTEGEYLKFLNGLTYDRLPIQLQRNLKRARLQVYVLKRETAKLYKYEVFKRLNRGGSELEDQEVRNCSVRLISDVFANFIQKLAKNASFIEALGISDTKVQEAFAEEMLLRFFAIKNNSAAFVHDVSPFLDKYMSNVSSGQLPFDYKAEEKKFDEVIELIGKIADKDKVFRSRRANRTPTGPFSSTIFESAMVGIAHNYDALKDKDGGYLEEKIIDFVLEAKKKSFVGAGSNTIVKLTGRLGLAKSLIK